MPALTTSLDLSAPILPGVGAAGLRLGTRVTDLPADLLAQFTLHRQVSSCVPNAVETTYRTSAVTLYVENRVIYQIALTGAYQGALTGPHGAISLGATIADAEQRLGPVVFDDQDNLTVAGITGLCLDVDDEIDHLPIATSELRPMQIKTIFVHRF